MPLDIFLKSIEGLSKWADLLLKNKIAIQEREQIAIDTLHKALSKTQIYTSALSSGEPHNWEAERELSDLWHQASSKLTFVDPDLSEICLLRGSYWSETDYSWSLAEINEAKTALDKITESIRQVKIRLSASVKK